MKSQLPYILLHYLHSHDNNLRQMQFKPYSTRVKKSIKSADEALFQYVNRASGDKSKL